MSSSRTGSPAGTEPTEDPSIDVVVPVYNEARTLAANVRRLRAYLDDSFPYPAGVVIADNASTDCSWDIASFLAEEHPGIRALHLEAKGRGRALRAAWSTSPAPVLCYMDADLSTDLACLLPLVHPLVTGDADVVVGSRLAPHSQVWRGVKREIISHTYNAIVRRALRSDVSDAQCGFKAIRSELAASLLPLVQDEEWFFDTELLFLAERFGHRIVELPVRWIDDPDTSVDLWPTVLADLAGVRRLRRQLSRPVGEIRASASRVEPAPISTTAGTGVGSSGTATRRIQPITSSSKFRSFTAPTAPTAG